MKIRMIMVATIAICLVLAGCRKTNEKIEVPNTEPASTIATENTEQTAAEATEKTQETTTVQDVVKAETAPEVKQEPAENNSTDETEYDLSDLVLGEDQLPFG